MLTKAAFDPETVSLLGAVLEQAIAALPPDDRSQERKTLLASKILSAAFRPVNEILSGCRRPHLRSAPTAHSSIGTRRARRFKTDQQVAGSPERGGGVPDDRVCDRLIWDCPQIASGIRHRNVLHACRLYHHPVCPNGRVRPSPVGISTDPTVLPGLAFHQRTPTCTCMIPEKPPPAWSRYGSNAR